MRSTSSSSATPVVQLQKPIFARTYNFTSVPQSEALHRKALPLPQGSTGKGQATSVQTGPVAVAVACCGSANQANVAASILASEIAKMPIFFALIGPFGSSQLLAR